MKKRIANVVSVVFLLAFSLSARSAALQTKPLRDLERDAGPQSESIAKDGYVPLDEAHAFEAGARGWNVWQPNFSVRAGVGHTGSAGLVWESVDTNADGIPSCAVPFRPGQNLKEPAPVVSGVSAGVVARAWKQNSETLVVSVNTTYKPVSSDKMVGGETIFMNLGGDAA